MNTVLFAHSAGPQGEPGEGSFDFVQWLRRELGDGWEVRFPIVEEPDAPAYPRWEKLLKKEFARCPDGVFLVGHSIGGSMLLKYLSEHRVAARISALVSVCAPWWGPEGWDVEDFVLAPDFSTRLPDIPEIHFFHAERDPVVSSSHLAQYEKRVPGLKAHSLPRKDHAFAGGLPEVAALLRALA
jgi:predicted alpha/beta hydrolase family esterase